MRRAWAWAIAATALLGAPAFAEENRYNLHLELGPLFTLDQPSGLINEQSALAGLHLRIAFEYSFMEMLGVEGGWGPNVMPPQQGDNTGVHQHIFAGVRFRPWHHPTGGYVLPTSDARPLRFKDFISDVWVELNPNLAVGGGTRVGFDVGAGVRVPLYAPVQLGLFVRYEMLFGVGDTHDDTSFKQLSVGITASVGFKPIKAEPDADGDGVPDARDKCPGTPAGAEVNDRGCEAKQPKAAPPPRCGDTDLDGVCDGEDACPDTPLGSKVDKRGCPSDTGTAPEETEPPAPAKPADE